MREWVINDYSGYKGLTLQECAESQPGDEDVRLRIEAFALNWGDADLMVDNYTFSFAKFPARVGIECSGVVDAIGANVTGIELGDRMGVMPYLYGNRGVSADSVVVEAQYLAKAPDSFSAVENASIWMKYLTAYFPMVELGKVNSQSYVLVTAATGTAGRACVEVAKMCGATVIATSRYERNTQYLKDAGADFVYITNESSPALKDVLDEITKGKGVNVIFDPVGGDMMSQYSPSLAQDAQIFFYGFLTGKFPDIPFIDLFNKNTIFHPYSVFHYVAKPDMRARAVEFIHRGVQTGQLTAGVDRVFSMEQYIDAWEYMRSDRSSHGKIVVETGFKP